MSKPERICVQKFLPQHAQMVDNINKDSSEGHTKLAAAFYKKKIWSAGTTINVSFTDKKPNIPLTKISEMNTANGPVDPLQLKYSQDKNLNILDAIKEIVKERIEPLTNLKFNFTSASNSNHVKISFDTDDGAWSLVGTDCIGTKGATMNLGWFDVATVMHEFGHVLGLIHEHQSSKETIKWNDKAVYAWADETQGWDKKTTQTNILNKYSNDQLNSSVFDPCSIMLYFFPAKLTLNNKGTNQNLRISPKDAVWIEKNYPGSLVTPSQYFRKSYNEDLHTSQQYCTKLGGKLGNKKSKLIWIIIIIIFIVLLIIAVIIWKKFSKKR